MLGGVFFKVVAQIPNYTEVLRLPSVLADVRTPTKRIFLPSDMAI